MNVEQMLQHALNSVRIRPPEAEGIGIDLRAAEVTSGAVGLPAAAVAG